MISHFRGCNNLVMTMSLLFLFFSLFFFGTPVIAAGSENPLVELSSAEELTEVAGYGEEKLSTVLVSGTVLCEACLEEKARLPPRPVSGAQVAVSCHTGERKRKSKIVRGSTDEFGDFLIDLPSHLHAIPNLEKLCLLKVLQPPKNSLCRPAFTVKHKRIKLSSVGNGIRTYTAQSIHLTPKPSAPCMTKQSNEKMAFLY